MKLSFYVHPLPFLLWSFSPPMDADGRRGTTNKSEQQYPWTGFEDLIKNSPSVGLANLVCFLFSDWVFDFFICVHRRLSAAK